MDTVTFTDEATSAAGLLDEHLHSATLGTGVIAGPPAFAREELEVAMLDGGAVHGAGLTHEDLV